MHISKEELKRVAKLSKLTISDDALETFRDHISNILTFISELKELDVSHAEAVGQISGEENNWREDIASASDDDERKAALSLAPELERGFIKVPQVFEDT